MLEEYRLDILSLSEKKLRGEDEMSFGGVRGVKSGVERRGNAREGVALLMSKYICMCLKEFRGVSYSIVNEGICIKM